MITYAQRLPGPGETLVAPRFALGVGGKGANQAVMAARLGAAVAFVAAVGDDPFGQMTLERLAEEGIDSRHVATIPGESSGVAPIWVEPDGTNRILIVPGANARLDSALAAEAVANANRVDVVVGQLEVPQAATLAAFRAARQRGAPTVLNPAPAEPLSAELLAVTDWLVPNEHEAAALAASVDLAIAVADVAVPAVFDRLQRAFGCGLVVTLGAAGAIGSDGRQIVAVPAPSVEAIDTTGAGDAFVGTFAVGIAAGTPLEVALEVATACASDSVTRPGTQASFPSREAAARYAGRLRA
jgi:ribokinase